MAREQDDEINADIRGKGLLASAHRRPKVLMPDKLATFLHALFSVRPKS